MSTEPAMQRRSAIPRIRTRAPRRNTSNAIGVAPCGRDMAVGLDGVPRETEARVPWAARSTKRPVERAARSDSAWELLRHVGGHVVDRLSLVRRMLADQKVHFHAAGCAQRVSTQ